MHAPHSTRPTRISISLNPITLAAIAAFCPLAAQAQDAASAPAAAASASVPAASASAPETTTLPAVRVKARAEAESATGPVNGYAARRSATATKTDTPLNEVPQAISVITADQVRDQNSSTLQDVLRYSAGVRHEMYGLDNRGDWFTLRGGSEGSVLLDGLRLPLTGWYGVIRNEPYAFERVEVLRGPASVIAGQNGPGGVVNLVSKRPQSDAVREIELQVGNDSHKQAAFDLGGGFGTESALSWRLLGLYKDSGTQVDYADQRRSFLAPSLSWRPSNETRFTVYAEHQNEDSANVNGFFPIEGTLRPAPNGLIPYDTFIGEPAWDRYGGERQRIGYELEQKLGSHWTLRHRLRHDRLEGDMRSMYAAWWLGYADATGAADPNGTYLNRVFYATDDKSRVTNADLLFEGKLRSGNVQHTVLVGVDAMKNHGDQRAYADSPGTPLDVYNPVYGSFALPDLSATAHDTTASRSRAVGVLLQDQVKFGGSLVLVGGVRRDRVKTTVDVTPFGSPVERTQQDDSATSKNLGAVYLAPGGVSPYVSYSESFETIAASGGVTFKPKRGKQFEAGVKWAPPTQRVSAAAAVYQLKETNRTTSGATPADPPVQLPEVLVHGLEIEAAANLPAWDLTSQYTYTNARQTNGPQLSSIPKHSASVWGVHRFDAYGATGLRAGLGVRHYGESSDGADDNTVPGVMLYDALVAYDRGAWRLALNVSNLTDKTYIATCLSRGDCWFGTKRRAVISAAYRW